MEAKKKVEDGKELMNAIDLLQDLFKKEGVVPRIGVLAMVAMVTHECRCQNIPLEKVQDMVRHYYEDAGKAISAEEK